VTCGADDGHRLGRLSVEVEVDDLDLAMRVRPVIESQAFGTLSGALERVLDDLDPGGAVTIGRLDLDLGTLPPDQLETDLVPAFVTALRAALKERLLKGETDIVQPWENADRLYVENAGLVLLNPYLPALFDRLGLLSRKEDRPFIAEAAAGRAVRVLQYLADGRGEAPEPALALNKLLCGLSPEHAVGAGAGPDEADRQVCDSLLQAVIANWPIIKNTSIEGLRETFLQRQGRLERGQERWNLQVQRKSLDVLVDQIPWTISTVFHRWMAEPVHVTW
jgi:hypothetical protein